MVVGNHQCIAAANLNQSKAQFQLELSLAQFRPSLYYLIVLFTRNFDTFGKQSTINVSLESSL